MIVVLAVGFMGVMVLLAGVIIALLTRLNYKLYTEFFKQIAMSNRKPDKEKEATNARK